MKIILILIDAFDSCYISSKNTPFMENLRVKGNFARISTNLGYSSCIIPSILTGTYPRKHKMWNEYFLQPRHPKNFLKILKVLPRQSKLAMGSQRLLYPLLGDFMKNTKPGIPAAIEHYFSKQEYDSAKIPPCHLAVPSLVDILDKERIGWEYLFYENDVPDERLYSNFFAGKPTLSLMYCAKFDIIGHVLGPNPECFSAYLKQIDNFLQSTFQLCEKEKEAHIIVMSDHGLSPVLGFVNLQKIIPPNIKLGKDFLVYIDDTMARFWFFSNAAEQDVRTALAEQSVGHLISKEELNQYGINFSDNKYFDLLYVLKEGNLFYPSYFPKIKKTVTKGLHGYLPNESHSSGVFFHSSSCSMTRHNISVIDILPSMLTLLDTEIPNFVDGFSFLSK